MSSISSTNTTLLHIQGAGLRLEIQKLPPVGGVSTWTHTHYVMANGGLVALAKKVGSINGCAYAPRCHMHRR